MPVLLVIMRKTCLKRKRVKWDPNLDFLPTVNKKVTLSIVVRLAYPIMQFL